VFGPSAPSIAKGDETFSQVPTRGSDQSKLPNAEAINVARKRLNAGSERDLPCSSFWNSPETRATIAKIANGNWEVPQNVEAWKSMLRTMVANNNEDQFPEAAHCLYGFVDLFHAYGSRLKQRWGPDWFELPAVELRDDHLSVVFLKFLREVLAVDRDRAVIAFRAILSRGLPFKMPGGHSGRYRSFDFGVEFLIQLTVRIDAILAREREKETRNGMVIDTEDRGRMPLVILDWIGKDRISLTYQRKDVRLTPLPSKLVYCLFLGKGSAVAYRTIWDELYPKLLYESVDTGPPEALKTHKKDINQILREAWGPPPRGHGWLEAEKFAGYFLNRSVKWQHAKDAAINAPLYFRPSRNIDNAARLDDDD